MDYNAYGFVKLEASLNGNPVPARVIIKLNTVVLFDVTLPEINGRMSVPLLPGTYSIDASYQSQTLPTKIVSITVAGETVTVPLVFAKSGNGGNMLLLVGIAAIIGIGTLYVLSRKG